MGMNIADAQFVMVTMTAIGALIVATGTLVWFIADQFKKARAEYWQGISSLHNTLVAQLDDHERKDDVRFDQITNQVWGLEVRNARRDGDRQPNHPPRRSSDDK